MKTKMTKVTPIVPVLMIPVFLVMLVAGCIGRNDEPTPANSVYGLYDVREFNVDTGELTDRFNATVTEVTGKEVTITHFSYFKTPVKATIDGTNLTIPAQTLDEDGSILELSGAGTVDLVPPIVLTYSYSVGGDANYEVDCIAVKY